MDSYLSCDDYLIVSTSAIDLAEMTDYSLT